MRRRWSELAGIALVGAMLLLAAPFIAHAVALGLEGLRAPGGFGHRLFHLHDVAATVGIFLHMLTGAGLTALAPLQLIGRIRRRWPSVHKATGYLLIALAFVTCPAGLIYIAHQGTIGGAQMSLAFAIYGLLLAGAALQTLRFARARAFDRHRRWALRFFVLAIGSWLYRVFYTLWWLIADGNGTAPDFTGPFDRVMNFGFYLPWLILLELWFRAGGRPSAP